MKRVLGILVVLIVIAAGAGFYLLRGEQATLSAEEGYGPNPKLPPPDPRLIPTTNVAETSPWPDGMKPKPAADLAVAEFAGGLDHPRMLHLLPNGDVLVAESNAPKPHDDTGFSIRKYVMGLLMSRAGAGVPSPDKIVLLRDQDGDGVAETKTDFITGLRSPFGMALVGGTLYVANTDAVVAFPYKAGETQITAKGEKFIDLPGGPINHHWTKDLVASKDGTKLYATVGSNSNVGENGLDKEEGRAAVWEIDIASRKTRIFASGLRNPNGITWNPQNGALWVAVNERDEIGSDLVPDYMTSVKDGGFYGWPFSYYGQHVDARPPANPEMVAKAIVPDYALGPHTASLGLAFYTGALLPAGYKDGVFVGQHGSWNRKPRSGYKVVFVPFTDGKPSGPPKDILTGFINADTDKAMGRPVGVAVDSKGALLVADDVGNKVWRVTPANPAAADAGAEAGQASAAQ